MNQCDTNLSISHRTYQKLRTSAEIHDKLLIMWHILNSMSFRGVLGSEVIVTERKYLSPEQLENCLIPQYGEKTASIMAVYIMFSKKHKQVLRTLREMCHVPRKITSYRRLVNPCCTSKWASPSA